MDGIIVKAISGFFYVDTGPSVVTCSARGRFRLSETVPLVGDLVRISVRDSGEGVLEEIYPRRNMFYRPSVANVDLLVIIASAAPPQTETFQIDRLTAIAEARACEPVLCLNKCDMGPFGGLVSDLFPRRFPHLSGKRQNRGRNRSAFRVSERKAGRLYRKFRCREIQHDQLH